MATALGREWTPSVARVRIYDFFVKDSASYSSSLLSLLFLSPPPSLAKDTRLNGACCVSLDKIHALLCRGTLLTRNRASLGPCSRTVPRALWWS